MEFKVSVIGGERHQTLCTVILKANLYMGIIKIAIHQLLCYV